jgi:trimeric autotransporter adhesin
MTDENATSNDETAESASVQIDAQVAQPAVKGKIAPAEAVDETKNARAAENDHPTAQTGSPSDSPSNPPAAGTNPAFAHVGQATFQSKSLLGRNGTFALAAALAATLAVGGIAYAAAGDMPPLSGGETSQTSSSAPSGANSQASAGSASQDSSSQNSLGEPPDEKGGGQGDPDANNQASGGGSGNAPEKPSGEDADNAPGEQSGQGRKPDDAPDGQNAPGGQGGPGDDAPGEPGQGGGANTQSFDYKGTYSATLTADRNSDNTTNQASNETVDATESLANAALAENGGALSIDGSTLNKAGDCDDGDSCNFYGVNSALLAVNEGSLITIQNSQISTTSEGSNGIFATDNATVLANGTVITTTKGNSRGLDATYGGTILANNMTISTQGGHSASIATDRGGGYISVANSTANTAGDGSPIIYSTGAIEVNNLNGKATGSQIAGMEGLNTISIWNSQLESTQTSRTGSDPIADGVIIYQSTSGDAETSTGEAARFQAVSSTLKSAIQSGAMFYCTNTQANIVLSGTVLDFDSNAANLITVTGNDSNSWGSAGKNGANVSFTGIGETLSGKVTADTISQLDLYLTEGSTWTGSSWIDDNESGANTSDSPMNINIDGTSTWVVTESCTVSTLNAADGAKIVDAEGKTASIVADGQTIVNGDSDITVTVDGGYSNTVELGSGQQVQDSTIDRSALDNAFGIETKF